MFPKDLVVFLESDGHHARRLEFAAALAKRWQAHLIATFVARPLDSDPHAGFAVGDAIEAMMEGLANAELRGRTLPILPAGKEKQAWRRALTTLIRGFSAADG